MSKFCRECGRAGCRIGWHQLATEGATNRESVATNAATNKANGETPLDQPVIPVVAKAIGVDSPERRTLNRRGRGVYNAYQKMYMAVVRAVAGGRACRWPRGA